MKNLFKILIDLFIYIRLGSIGYARKKGVTIGENCRIYIKSWGSEPFLIKIGNNVTITSGVRLITHDGSVGLYEKDGYRYQYYKNIEIGDNVFIGVNSIVMPGVKVGSNIIVGAGSIVTKNIESNTVVAGNPAKYICSYTDYEAKVRDRAITEKELKGYKSYYDKVIKAIELCDGKKD